MQPQILVLKEGTEAHQGKAQVVSNINACQAVVDAVRTTLGPRGMDKLVVDQRYEGKKLGQSKIDFCIILGTTETGSTT